MNHEHDPHLRDRFAQMRSEDAAGAPAFRAMLAGAERRARRSPRGVRLTARAMATAAVLAALALGLLLLRRPASRVELDRSATRWRGPTDFLLQLPGDQLLRTMPRLGELNSDWRNP